MKKEKTTVKPIHILLIRSQDLLSDSRVLRYEDWFCKNDIEYTLLGWDRMGKGIQRPHTDYYRKKTPYNLGTRGIGARIKWSIFLIHYLWKHRKDYTHIHACDFDTVLPALMMKIIGKKVIFDIFDWYSDEVKTYKKIIDVPLNFLEKRATRWADLTLICEEERLEQMGIIPKHYKVIPNIVQGQVADEILEINVSYDLVYVGGFYKERGLEILLEVVEQVEGITLCIGGFGDIEIEERAKRASERCSRITYMGKVPYKEVLNILATGKVVYAMYYTHNPNHLFAAPNKFYEAIALEKPILTNEGTLVSKKVKKYNTGYVIQEGKKALKEFLRTLKNNELKILEEKKISIKTYKQTYGYTLEKYLENYKKFLEKS